MSPHVKPANEEGKGQAMRTLLLTVILAGLVLVLPAAPTLAAISTTQHVPTAACNQGTMTAHMHIPPLPGNGMNPNLSRFNDQTNAHNAVPGMANVSPCGHGG
jgi:hypothetical protein